jgi:GNAT superfamily N-acetyltransferase
LLTGEDLPFADSVRAQAGWNQTIEDWKRFLAAEPTGCFVAEWNCTLAGTATTIVYGRELAWIGMILVHPDYRRRGIGRALLHHCIEYLQGRGVRCLKLDATPLGKKVYDDLGFKNEWTVRRWAGRFAPPQATATEASLRPWRVNDAQLVEQLDATAFGVSRRRLLVALAQQSCGALVLEAEPGCITGYGLLRPGSRAFYLGPVVAASAEVGIRLVEALVARSDGELIFWDIPDQNEAAVSWAEQHGFTVQRPLTRMFLGENLVPGDPQQQFALAGPEIG